MLIEEGSRRKFYCDLLMIKGEFEIHLQWRDNLLIILLWLRGRLLIIEKKFTYSSLIWSTYD